MAENVTVMIDQELMAKAVREVVQKGLAEGVGSWETQRLIQDAVKNSVDTTGLPAMIEEALTGRFQEEAPAIVEAIVEDALPLVREAFRFAFRKALRAMVYGLALGTPSGYMGDDEKRAWREAQELLGEEVTA